MKIKSVKLPTGIKIKFDDNGNITSLNTPYLKDKNYTIKLKEYETRKAN